MNLYYYYDPDADILYISQGKPSSKDISQETVDDVVLRLDPKSLKVKGFTVLNFVRRLRHKERAVSIPIRAELMPA